MLVWKGAAPGSWWHTNNAQTGGFFGPAATGPTAMAVLRHITIGSSPSPFCSFTTSYAVALDYATNGGTVPHGGYIYEVDLSTLPPHAVYDPVQTISSAVATASHGAAAFPIAHGHDGPTMLVAAVTQRALAPGVLDVPPPRPGNMGSTGAGPVVTQYLAGLVFAIRDAEVLLTNVPASSVTMRYNV